MRPFRRRFQPVVRPIVRPMVQPMGMVRRKQIIKRSTKPSRKNTFSGFVDARHWRGKFFFKTDVAVECFSVLVGGSQHVVRSGTQPSFSSDSPPARTASECYALRMIEFATQRVFVRLLLGRIDECPRKIRDR